MGPHIGESFGIDLDAPVFVQDDFRLAGRSVALARVPLFLLGIPHIRVRSRSLPGDWSFPLPCPLLFAEFSPDCLKTDAGVCFFIQEAVLLCLP